MADSPENNQEKELSDLTVDLSQLQGLSFQPKWESSKKEFHKEPFDNKRAPRDGQHKKPFVKRDRPASPSDRNDKRPSKHFTEHPGSRKGNTKPVFTPTIQVKFFPEDAPFQALAKVIRSSCRTYELFEIAHLILQKPERFVVSLKPLQKEGEKEHKTFSISIPDGLPFENEADALTHIIKNHLSNYFDVEETTVDAPKGNYQIVNRCGITGTLLAPPNYHRYQDILKDHYTSNFSQMPYEKFLSRIETLRDEEQVKAWLEKMTKITQYKLKETAEGQEPVILGSIEQVRSYLLKNCKAQIIQETGSIRLSGKAIEEIPQGNIKRSIQASLEAQRKFPLETCSALRGILRHMNFFIYKKGNHGVSYLCSVKRKFRTEQTVLSDSVNGLIQFIEKTQRATAATLPEKYLGIVLPKAQPVAENTTEPAAETVPAPSLSAEDEEKVRRLMLDLRWLVTEGYVTEYGDGALYAPAMKPTVVKAEASANQLEQVLEASTEVDSELIQEEETFETEGGHVDGFEGDLPVEETK